MHLDETQQELSCKTMSNLDSEVRYIDTVVVGVFPPFFLNEILLLPRTGCVTAEVSQQVMHTTIPFPELWFIVP